jgi:NADH:ubiquinone oxidoreductase subunit K
MDGRTLLPVLIVVAAVCGVTWLAISSRQPRLRGVFRYVLLTVAIASTTLLIASVALYVVLSRGSSDSPAAAVPLLFAILCAVVAVPAWIGFVIQAHTLRRKYQRKSDNA